MDSIGDAWDFSVETLIGITLSWKTELNRSISTIRRQNTLIVVALL